MAEGEGVGAKVRVVRCPKCDKLLPELANFTIYRCGGCDATLQAKKQSSGVETLPEKFDGISSKCLENIGSMEDEQLLKERDSLEGLVKTKAEDNTEIKASWPKNACRAEEMSGAPALQKTQKVPVFMGDLKAASHPAAGPSNFNYNPIHSNSEHDRAELMRKLDELRDQIKQSCEVAGAPPPPEAKVPANSMHISSNGRNGCAPDGFSTQHSPFSNGHNADMPRFYPSAPLQSGIHGCRETCRPYPFPSFNYNGHYHGDGLYHQSLCACMQCYNGHWPMPAQLPPTFLGNPRLPPCSFVNHGFYTVDGRSHGYNHQTYGARKHTRSNFLGKERRSCRPFAGAAPFIVCYNCSELLQVPEEILQMGKHQHKLRCGSCSQLIAFELEGRRLVTSENNADMIHGLKDVPQCQGNINRRQVISYSIDYDSPSYDDVRLAEEKMVMPSFPVLSSEVAEKENGLNHSDSEKLLQGLSSSSSTSEGVESPDCVICPRDGSDAITRVPSLPLREHFVKQNSVKDVPVATELDLSSEDYPNAGFSHDSWDASKEEDEQHRGNKGGESFLTGLIKKSFKDLSRFNQSAENGRPKVLINGHSISERSIKRAEKLAGPIHSGEYWYDYRAGFWGVMGHACLGIIPPFIEEFNYPMTKNCAAGNTGVLVNGRELNEKDLTLLAGRGLPVTEGRSYIIEISGKLWDEETGEELDSLGKLAPTVERVKRGFGMRAPRVIP